MKIPSFPSSVNPGTARLAASAGRSLMFTMSLIFPLVEVIQDRRPSCPALPQGDLELGPSAARHALAGTDTHKWFRARREEERIPCGPVGWRATGAVAGTSRPSNDGTTAPASHSQVIATAAADQSSIVRRVCSSQSPSAAIQSSTNSAEDTRRFPGGIPATCASVTRIASAWHVEATNGNLGSQRPLSSCATRSGASVELMLTRARQSLRGTLVDRLQ